MCEGNDIWMLTTLQMLIGVKAVCSGSDGQFFMPTYQKPDFLMEVKTLKKTVFMVKHQM